jgi:hypothetical protein
MNKSSLIIVIACAALTACACFAPTSAEIAKAPQIRFGQPLPKEGDYVLLFPAGTPLPVSVAVGGNLFEREQQATLQVTLKRDVYVFGHFASFDGKNWSRSYKLIKSELKLEIPQKDGSNAGLLRLNMNQE